MEWGNRRTRDQCEQARDSLLKGKCTPNVPQMYPKCYPNIPKCTQMQCEQNTRIWSGGGMRARMLRPLLLLLALSAPPLVAAPRQSKAFGLGRLAKRSVAVTMDAAGVVLKHASQLLSIRSPPWVCMIWGKPVSGRG